MTLTEKLNFSPEERLLLLCARLDLSQTQRSELHSLTASPLRWEKVLYQAQWHGLTGLVFHHLKELATWEMLAPQVRDQLKAAYLANGARNFQGMSELARVLDALQGEKIPVTLLKGAALSEEVYQDISLRPMSDLDILVPEDKVFIAQETVQGLGYHQIGTLQEQQDTVDHHRHLPGLVCQDKPVLVEIHRHVVRRDSGLYFDIKGFWERAQAVEVAGRPALVLSPEDQVIHLCLNFFLDRGFRSQAALRQLCDVAETIRCYNSPYLYARLNDIIHDYNLDGPVSCVLYAAEKLLDAPVPEKVVQEFWPKGFAEGPMASYLKRRVLDTRPWVARSLARPGSKYRWSHIAMAALGRLLASRRCMVQPRHQSSADLSVGQLYLTRLWKGVGILFQAAMRPDKIKEDLSIDHWIHSLLPTQGELSQ